MKTIANMYSERQKYGINSLKTKQNFVQKNLFSFYGYYENIYLFIIVTPVYSTQFWLNFLIRLVLLYFGRHCISKAILEQKL
jgi:hypothetical protein